MCGHRAFDAIDLEAFRTAGHAQRAEIGRTVDEVCRSTGFLVIENHGVGADVMEAAWSAARGFFDRPLSEKMALAPDDSRDPRGYFPMTRETLTLSRGVSGPPDAKEAFSSGPETVDAALAANPELRFFYGPNRWPPDPPGFRDAWIHYYGAMETLSLRVMSLFAAALDLPADFFNSYFERHTSALRALNYPPADAGTNRAGAHSDYGSLTILKPDPAVAGLEIEVQPGEWLAAPVVEDAFIVNIGDLMSRWTNDRWTSTVHRVATGNAREKSDRRQSLAFFHNPNHDALIECLPGCLDSGAQPRYAPIRWGEYLRDRFVASQSPAPAQ